MCAAPWELGGEQPTEGVAPSNFENYQDTRMLQHGKSVSKRGLVSPGLSKDAVAGNDETGRRVRLQPRMHDGNALGASEAAPTLQAGAASVFSVGREPSDECGMFRGDAGLFTFEFSDVLLLFLGSMNSC
jgi:hypothetical protein